MATTNRVQAYDVAEWCQQQWEVVSSNTGEGLQLPYDEILARWLQYGEKCGGSVVYEGHLATLYAEMNETAKARETLKPVVGKNSKYDDLVEMAYLQAEVHDILAGSQADKRQQIKALETKYVAFVQKYPDFVPGYAMLGGIQSMLDEHREAIRTLISALNHTDKAKRRSPNLWGVYRNLAISYAETENYPRALAAADVAFELKKGITSDQYFAYAVARASAGTGDFKAAQDALRVIAAKVPNAKNNPKYIETMNFVAEKTRAARPKP